MAIYRRAPLAWLYSVLTFLEIASARPLLVITATCVKTDSPKTVRVIRQWPLPPMVFTKEFKEKYPNERNQTAIYSALLDDVKKKKVDLVVGEGCEGDIGPEFTAVFNGWTFESLRKVAFTKSYDRILTHVPLKLAARFEDKLRVKCGDNAALIQEGNVRITNLRGWSGYLSHLREKYVDDRGKLYADGAADLLKISRATPLPELLTKVKDKVRGELAAFRRAIGERDDGFLKLVTETEFSTAAIVINGLHADDLKAKLQDAKLNCEIYEPPGYQKEDERLIQEFERLLAD